MVPHELEWILAPAPWWATLNMLARLDGVLNEPVVDEPMSKNASFAPGAIPRERRRICAQLMPPAAA